MGNEAKTIYIVEDDKNLRRVIEFTARSVSPAVECFNSAEETLVAIRTNSPDLIITDFQLAGSMNGIDLIKTVRQSEALEMPIILVSGVADVVGTLKDFVSVEKQMLFVSKPFSTRKLAADISELLFPADDLPAAQKEKV